MFHSTEDGCNFSLGRARSNLKMGKRVGAKNDQSIMPPIADFDFSFRREDWSNVIACHDGNSQVSTWSTKRRCLTENFLKHKCLNKLVKTFPTCVAMSESGDFGFIGYSNGMLHKYNMQSSLFRGAFERGSTASAHDGAVTGICTHMINNLLISSGKDNLLRVWNFNSAIFVGSLMLEETGTKMLLNRDNLLLAIVQKGGRIVIVNVKTRKLARVLEGEEVSQIVQIKSLRSRSRILHQRHIVYEQRLLACISL